MALSSFGRVLHHATATTPVKLLVAPDAAAGSSKAFVTVFPAPDLPGATALASMSHGPGGLQAQVTVLDERWSDELRIFPLPMPQITTYGRTLPLSEYPTPGYPQRTEDLSRVATSSGPAIPNGTTRLACLLTNHGQPLSRPTSGLKKLEESLVGKDESLKVKEVESACVM